MKIKYVLCIMYVYFEIIYSYINVKYLYQVEIIFFRFEQFLNNIIDILGKYKVVNEKNVVVEFFKLNLILVKIEIKDMNYSK